MNIGISTAQASWKRPRFQFILAAAGVALVAIVAIAAVSLQDGKGSSGDSRTATVAVPQPNLPEQTLLYVVASQEEAVALELAFAEAADSGRILRHVMVVDSPEDELGLAQLQAELASDSMASSTSTIIDTRQSPVAIEASPLPDNGPAAADEAGWPATVYPLVQEFSHPQ